MNLPGYSGPPRHGICLLAVFSSSSVCAILLLLTIPSLGYGAGITLGFAAGAAVVLLDALAAGGEHRD